MTKQEKEEIKRDVMASLKVELIELIQKNIVEKSIDDIYLGPDDTLCVPISIGTKSSQEARESLQSILEYIKPVFPNNKIIMWPHKDDKFYYMSIIRQGDLIPEEAITEEMIKN